MSAKTRERKRQEQRKWEEARPARDYVPPVFGPQWARDAFCRRCPWLPLVRISSGSDALRKEPRLGLRPMHAHTLWDTQQLQQVFPALAVCPSPAEFANASPAMSCPLSARDKLRACFSPSMVALEEGKGAYPSVFQARGGKAAGRFLSLSSMGWGGR